MNPERVLPLIVAVLYFLTAVFHLRKGETPAAGLWLCYSVSNIFMVWALIQNSK